MVGTSGAPPETSRASTTTEVLITTGNDRSNDPEVSASVTPIAAMPWTLIASPRLRKLLTVRKWGATTAKSALMTSQTATSRPMSLATMASANDPTLRRERRVVEATDMSGP